ncbi:MAG: ribonuclease H-like domain-containing protein [Candidatus Zixiibacteriota bacterium]
MSASNDIKSRLARINSQLPRTEPKAPPATAGSERARKLKTALGGSIVTHDNGEFLLLRRRHEPDYSHGSRTIRDFFQRDDYRLSHVTINAEPKKLSKQSFLFFDTETTGLGGAGSLAFLVGMASLVDGALETRQYLLPDYADESAMLSALYEEFNDDTIIVSYNGRSFDEPLLLDRLRINRVANSLPYSHHLDLLYPARSLFKRRIRDCSLGNVEAEVFGHYREDDIPGYLVPGVYFDWAHNDTTDSLAGVIEHNRQDIVSLALLIAVITECHETAGKSLTEPLDVYSLMRREARRERQRAAKIGLDNEEELAAVRDTGIDFQRSMVYKRAGEITRAVELWLALERGRDLTAQLGRLELAKWYEHKERDFKRALKFSEKGLRFSLNHDRECEHWQKRCARLKRRLGIEV